MFALWKVNAEAQTEIALYGDLLKTLAYGVIFIFSWQIT